MVTKKLRYFEFGSHSDKGSVKESNYDGCASFDSPNGYCFVLCDGVDEVGSKARDIALERIQYFMEKEYVEDPFEAVQSALIYAGGYINEYARKNEFSEQMAVNCLCVLIRDNKIYYASLGNCCMFLFDGRRLYTLVQDTTEYPEGEERQSEGAEESKMGLLGSEKFPSPFVCEQPLVPLNNDVIILCTDGFYDYISEKNVKKILTDPMPIYTKASRLADMAKQTGSDDNITLQIISFYNLDNDMREFTEAEHQQKEDLPRTAKIDITGNPLWDKIIIGIVILFAGYMFYDLFLFNPRPEKDFEKTNDITVSDTIPDSRDVADDEKEDKILDINALLNHYAPDDTVYNVRSGDTWGSIYRRFEVCSWFIRSMDENQGKFDRQGNPVAGTRIVIPLTYSANTNLNPRFYKEFTTNKVGGSCQNADEQFIENFHNSIKENLHE